MTKQIAILVTACIATLAPLGIPAAEAKQQCKASMPSDPHGQWWSYRLIDGRKCWYEGKPGFSKALLEWPKEATTEPPSEKVVRPVKERVASTVKEKVGSPIKEKITAANKEVQPRSPLDSQAWAPIDLDSFEARWRARVEDR